jgi:hypothetical protein
MIKFLVVKKEIREEELQRLLYIIEPNMMIQNCGCVYWKKLGQKFSKVIKILREDLWKKL